MQNKMIPKEALMPQVFDPLEVWEVSVNRETFRLNGKQAQLLKDATIAGQRGLIFFDGFAISIPHISFMARVRTAEEIKQIKDQKTKLSELKKKIGWN